MQNKQIEYYILGFKRLSEFPKPGSIVALPQTVIEAHIESIELEREPGAAANGLRIAARLLAQTDVEHKKLFIDSPEEVKHKLYCEVAVGVDSIIIPESKRDQMLAKLDIQSMFMWPTDIKDQDKFIEIDVNDLVVIEPVLCNCDQLIIDTKPNESTSFGWPIKTKSSKQLYRSYNAVSSEEQKELKETLSALLFTMGLKEWSRIIPYNPNMSQHATKYPADVNAKSGSDYVNLLREHPLHQYSKLLYLNIIATILDQGLPVVEDLRNELYYSVFDTMLGTGVSDGTRTYIPSDSKKRLDNEED